MNIGYKRSKEELEENEDLIIDIYMEKDDRYYNFFVDSYDDMYIGEIKTKKTYLHTVTTHTIIEAAIDCNRYFKHNLDLKIATAWKRNIPEDVINWCNTYYKVHNL